jgi:hypothetical protein
MGQVVKHIARSSPNVELILQAFEEQRWPPGIDDPLPPVRGRNRKRRLHDTIQNLNRRLDLPLLVFHGDGFGNGIRWERAALTPNDTK